MKNKVLVSCILLLIFIASVLLGEQRTLALRNGDTNTLHEWLGLILLGGMLLHIVLYWKVMITMITRWWQTPFKTKLNTLVFILLLGMVMLSIVSGIMISPHLGFGQMHSHWNHLHHVVPKLTIVPVLIHTLLRWQKVKALFKKPQKP